jgi:hypothetical protein
MAPRPGNAVIVCPASSCAENLSPGIILTLVDANADGDPVTDVATDGMENWESPLGAQFIIPSHFPPAICLL